MTDRELAQRLNLREREPALQSLLDETDRPEEQYQCTVCKTFCYLSQVICKCTTAVVCLEHADSLCACTPSDRTLRMRFSDDRLTTILARVADKHSSPSLWRTKFSKLLSDTPRPPLKAMRTLLAEGEHLGIHLPELADLKAFVTRANTWITQASAITTRKTQIRKRARKSIGQESAEADPHPLEDALSLLEEVKVLGFDAPEISLLKSIVSQAEDLKSRTITVLQDISNGPDLQECENILLEGSSLTIRIDELKELDRLVKRLQLMRELGHLDEDALTLDHIHELLLRAKACEVPSDHTYMKELTRRAVHGEKWRENALHVLSLPIQDLHDLDNVASPPVWVPIVPELLDEIDSCRHQAKVYERQAKELVSNVNIAEVLSLVKRAMRDYHIEAIADLSKLAEEAATIENACEQIYKHLYQVDSQRPLFEQLRSWRTRVEEELMIFEMPYFRDIDRQLAEHDAWLPTLPWFNASHPAMQGDRIFNDVLENTRIDDDLPPLDPTCTCICPRPVQTIIEPRSSELPEAVQCDHCAAKFHASCIEGSCPFCDHHHWNGSISKPRQFNLHDLIPIARAAPELTRDYSLVWKHLDTIITRCIRLSKAFDTFLSKVPTTETGVTSPAIIAQLRHYMRKLYKIQFNIKPRPDLPPYGLSLAHLHRMLAPPVPLATTSLELVPKKRLNKRPKFVFKYVYLFFCQRRWLSNFWQARG
jgi:histone demethylase JARID1